MKASELKHGSEGGMGWDGRGKEGGEDNQGGICRGDAGGTSPSLVLVIPPTGQTEHIPARCHWYNVHYFGAP